MSEHAMQVAARPTFEESLRGFSAMIRSGAMDVSDHEMVARKFDDASAEIERLTKCSMDYQERLLARGRERDQLRSVLDDAREEVWLKDMQGKRGTATKRKVLTMVERGGRSVSVKVEDLTQQTLKTIIGRTVVLDSTLNTDEAQHYKALGKNFAAHDAVNHSAEEYVRYEGKKQTTTNTVEGFFGIFKRGMRGVYHHCGEHHLQAYLNEFDFRYSNRSALKVDDTERTRRAIKGAAGKRLTYRQPSVGCCPN